jgi:hypothetical protein
MAAEDSASKRTLILAVLIALPKVTIIGADGHVHTLCSVVAGDSRWLV